MATVKGIPHADLLLKEEPVGNELVTIYDPSSGKSRAILSGNLLGDTVAVQDEAARLSMSYTDAVGKFVSQVYDGTMWKLKPGGDPSDAGDWFMVGSSVASDKYATRVLLKTGGQLVTTSIDLTQLQDSGGSWGNRRIVADIVLWREDLTNLSYATLQHYFDILDTSGTTVFEGAPGFKIPREAVETGTTFLIRLDISNLDGIFGAVLKGTVMQGFYGAPGAYGAYAGYGVMAYAPTALEDVSYLESFSAVQGNQTMSGSPPTPPLRPAQIEANPGILPVESLVIGCDEGEFYYRAHIRSEPVVTIY